MNLNLIDSFASFAACAYQDHLNMIINSDQEYDQAIWTIRNNIEKLYRGLNVNHSCTIITSEGCYSVEARKQWFEDEGVVQVGFEQSGYKRLRGEL